MALQELRFVFPPREDFEGIPPEWSHTGVVGSGDMEVLLRQKALSGGVEARVNTPVSGFDHIWQRVLADFVEEENLGDVEIEINDNNATPFIVATRLRQALAEAKGGGAV